MHGNVFEKPVSVCLCVHIYIQERLGDWSDGNKDIDSQVMIKSKKL